MPTKTEVKYLGCHLNDDADLNMEIRRRKADCVATVKRLHQYFRNSDNSVRFKIQVLNAVIRSKLIYGLGTAVLTRKTRTAIDTFQLKGLRKIRRWTTTYMDHTHTPTKTFTSKLLAGHTTPSTN